MTLEGFYNLLKADAAVAAVVEDRIHYERQPQGGQNPSIILQLGLATHGHMMSGPAGYAEGFVRVNCLAPTPAAASDLADAARVAVNGFRGDAGGVRFAFIVVGDEQPIPHNVPEGEPLPNVHGILFDAKFMVKSNTE